jgi:type II secretory pathway component GspD/PulD (secretin)
MPGAFHPLKASSSLPRLKRIALWVCVASAWICPAIALAASRPGWFERPFHYVVINQDVRGILTEFGRNVGVPVILSDKVGGRVRGDVAARAKNVAEPPTAGEFLSHLTEANALTWYFDGSILYLSADQEFSTQLIEVGVLSPDAIITELKRLSLLDERFSVRSAGNAGLISVSGPPAFIAIVRQIVDKMRPPPAVAGDDPRVRVFRGGAPAEVVRARNASASPQDGVGPGERVIEATRDAKRQR